MNASMNAENATAAVVSEASLNREKSQITQPKLDTNQAPLPTNDFERSKLNSAQINSTPTSQGFAIGPPASSLASTPTAAPAILAQKKRRVILFNEVVPVAEWPKSNITLSVNKSNQHGGSPAAEREAKGGVRGGVIGGGGGQKNETGKRLPKYCKSPHHVHNPFGERMGSHFFSVPPGIEQVEQDSLLGIVAKSNQNKSPNAQTSSSQPY